ncbi:hypothetical protein C7458_11427 [Williamsia muralis]|nr:hypothetical protein C7458_11427 [Williamsia marianensis]
MATMTIATIPPIRLKPIAIRIRRACLYISRELMARSFTHEIVCATDTFEIWPAETGSDTDAHKSDE